MRVLLIEVIIIVVVLVVLRLIRNKLRFFRGGYVVRKDSYMQNDEMRIIVEDTHFFRGKARENRSMRVGGGNLVYSRIPLDKENKVLMVYSYCAPLLGMLKGGGTSIRRTLTLGGGGGAVPLYILQSYDGSTADVVEFNEGSIDMMRKYFLQDYAVGEKPRANLIHADAKDVVKSLEAPYQFIFCDLYVGGQPAELTYDEAFMQDVSRLAGETGMLVINGGSLNMWGVRFVMRTLLKTFTNAWAMYLGGEGFVLVAANREIPPMDNLLLNGNGVIPLYPANTMTKEFLMADSQEAPTQRTRVAEGDAPPEEA